MQRLVRLGIDWISAFELLSSIKYYISRVMWDEDNIIAVELYFDMRLKI